MHSDFLSRPSPSRPGLYALVVDDHPMTAQGMAQFLRHLGMAHVHTVSDAAQCLHFIASHGAPCLAVVDFWLDAGASTSMVSDMLALAPACRVLMTSGDSHHAIALKARACGAHGFVHKTHSPDMLEKAVKALLGGAPWFDATQAAPTRPAGTQQIRMTAAELGLTPRQGQVLALVLRGQPNSVIARNLHLSPHTVKEHVAATLQRLGVRNRIEAITRLQGIDLELPAAEAGGDQPWPAASARCSSAYSATGSTGLRSSI